MPLPEPYQGRKRDKVGFCLVSPYLSRFTLLRAGLGAEQANSALFDIQRYFERLPGYDTALVIGYMECGPVRG